MKKFVVKLATVVAISALSTSIALAAGHLVKVTMDCPDIKGKGVDDKVINYGTYLAGTGIEKVNSDEPTYPLFQGTIVPGSDIPIDLKAAKYHNCGVEYNPTTGGVICKYKSFCGHDPFSIGYVMKNANDGTVAGSGKEQIHIKLPVGLK